MSLAPRFKHAMPCHAWMHAWPTKWLSTAWQGCCRSQTRPQCLIPSGVPHPSKKKGWLCMDTEHHICVKQPAACVPCEPCCQGAVPCPPCPGADGACTCMSASRRSVKAGQCLEVQGSLGQGRWEVTRQPSPSMDSSLRAMGSTCAAQPLCRWSACLHVCTYAHAYAHPYRGWQGLVQPGAAW